MNPESTDGSKRDLTSAVDRRAATLEDSEDDWSRYLLYRFTTVLGKSLLPPMSS